MGQLHAPAVLYTGEDPVPIVMKAGWAPGPVCTGAENLAHTGIRFPDCPARSQSLYQLRYQAYKTKSCTSANIHTVLLCARRRFSQQKIFLSTLAKASPKRPVRPLGPSQSLTQRLPWQVSPMVSREFNLQALRFLYIGQAFRFSPENAFYIFNQQIYFIIWYLLDRASLI